jgi:hypothetical protein
MDEEINYGRCHTTTYNFNLKKSVLSPTKSHVKNCDLAGRPFPRLAQAHPQPPLHAAHACRSEWRRRITRPRAAQVRPTAAKRAQRASAGARAGTPTMKPGIRSSTRAAIRGLIRSSASSSASGSMPSTYARMVWTCSTSVRWDASCGAFSLPICLRCKS